MRGPAITRPSRRALERVVERRTSPAHGERLASSDRAAALAATVASVLGALMAAQESGALEGHATAHVGTVDAGAFARLPGPTRHGASATWKDFHAVGASVAVFLRSRD